MFLECGNKRIVVIKARLQPWKHYLATRYYRYQRGITNSAAAWRSEKTGTEMRRESVVVIDTRTVHNNYSSSLCESAAYRYAKGTSIETRPSIERVYNTLTELEEAGTGENDVHVLWTASFIFHWGHVDTSRTQMTDDWRSTKYDAFIFVHLQRYRYKFINFEWVENLRRSRFKLINVLTLSNLASYSDRGGNIILSGVSVI